MPTTRSFQLKQGQLIETQQSPEELAALRKLVSERFSETGEDRLFTEMRERYTQALKRKSRRAA